MRLAELDRLKLVSCWLLLIAWADFGPVQRCLGRDGGAKWREWLDGESQSTICPNLSGRHLRNPEFMMTTGHKNYK